MAELTLQHHAKLTPRLALGHSGRLGFCFVVSLIYCLLCSPSLRAETFEHGPDVVIIAGEDKVIYEFRQNGQLRLVRIVPTWGKPYYLVPRDETKGFGDLQRADMLLPRWIIAEF